MLNSLGAQKSKDTLKLGYPGIRQGMPCEGIWELKLSHADSRENGGKLEHGASAEHAGARSVL